MRLSVALTTVSVNRIAPLRYHRRIVHWIEMQENGPDGDGYHNVWGTDIKPNQVTAMLLAKAGRMRCNSPMLSGYI